ncbi:uncharacterized protein [Panulirus ornatus]|uniref:uncharacterized protein isoform X2 n=1 Tax=Panulirus ornatus TaxID=150431 RepID=UPI003A8B8030
MAFVLLPCDLPTWPTIQRHLTSLKSATSPDQVTQVLHTLHSLCNVSIEPELSEAVPEDVFAGVERFLTNEADPEFFRRTLPTMVDAALRLKDLKPPQGLTYSLQQQSEDLVIDRRLVSSLLAHTFFCTLPRRSLISHPTLSDPCLAPTLASLHRESQRVKVRALFQYFRTLGQHPCPGHLTFSRKVMGSKEFVTLGDWVRSEEKLCPVVIQHEGRLEDAPPPALLACFTSPDLARPALTRSNSQQVCAMLSQPELLVTAVFVERLEDNEAMQVSGALRTSTVSNLKTRPTVVPRKNVGPPDLVHVLMDADDYRHSEVLQYEEINVLRELNKARLAFTQSLPDQQPPHQSLSDIISVSRQHSPGTVSPPTRFRTQVSSGSSGEVKKEEASFPNLSPSKMQVNAKESTADWVNGSNILKKREKERAEAKQKSTAVKEGNPTELVSDDRAEGVKSKGGTLTKARRKRITAKEDEKPKEKEKSAETPRVVKDERPAGKPAKKGKDAAKQESAGSASPGEQCGGFVTAPTTLKRRRKKKDERSKGANKAPLDVAVAPPTASGRGEIKAKEAERVTFAAKKEEEKEEVATKDAVGKSREELKDQRADPEEDEETTRLLNRVLRAIQRLEQERPDLLQEAKLQEQQTHTPTTTPTQKLQGKPPLPGADLPRTGDSESPRAGGLRARSSSREHRAAKPSSLRDSGATQADRAPMGEQGPRPPRLRIGAAPDGRKLSIYYSCTDELQQDVPSPDEEHYYSASENLDCVEAARPRRPCKRRERRPRRKSSFAERLKETLARKLSVDSQRPSVTQGQDADHTHETEGHQPRLSRQGSGGFMLDDDLPRTYGKEAEEEEEGRDSEEEEEEEEEDSRKDKQGSGSSHYSFSSDYISDLEEVYEQLEAVLEDPQEGQLGPRTAAIAKFAHGLLKRALSESYKDMSLGLDGSALRSPQGADPLPPRSLSLSEPHNPTLCSLNPPSPLRTLKSNLSIHGPSHSHIYVLSYFTHVMGLPTSYEVTVK